MWIPKEIGSIATRLQNGQRVKRITVRRLLELFEAERRGPQKVQEIKNVLEGLNLETEPDFEHAWIDSTIKIRLKGTAGHESDAGMDHSPDSSQVEATQFTSQNNGAAAQSPTGTAEEHTEQKFNYERVSDPGTGMEETDDAADTRPITEPFDPREIRIETKQLSLDVLISRIQNSEIVLQPDFQRKEVWKPRAQSRLIESLLIRIPIPAFYMDATNDEKWLVVDGQQRLSTLRQFVIDKRLRLTELEFLGLEGKSFDELERPLQRRIKETNVTVYLIEKGTPAEVKLNVFKRINTGGEPLSAQEIRHALHDSNVNGLLKALATSAEFLQATGGSVPVKRMQDRELVVRFFAFLLNPPEIYATKRDFDSFLGDTMTMIDHYTDSQREVLRERFLRAMRRSTEILGRYAFRKRSTFETDERLLPLNKALFEAWSVNLEALTEDQVRSLNDRSRLMWQQFRLLLDQRNPFYQAISQGTGDPNRVTLRFSEIKRLIQETLA